MSTKTEICNIALVRLRAATITDITDGTQLANLCNTIYDTIAEEVMMEGPWPSCIFRADLALTTSTPEFEFSNEYQLPTDPKVLRVIDINRMDVGEAEYKIEGDKLLTDAGGVEIKYIGVQPQPGKYDPMLRRAIISRLTAELAYPVTGDASLTQFWQQKHMVDLDDGLGNISQQGSREVIDSNDLTDIR